MDMVNENDGGATAPPTPPTQTPSVKDCYGTPVTIGSTIVYPNRRGSAMWLCRATVVDFFTFGRSWRDEPVVIARVLTDNGKRTTFSCWARCVVVPGPDDGLTPCQVLRAKAEGVAESSNALAHVVNMLREVAGALLRDSKGATLPGMEH